MSGTVSAGRLCTSFPTNLLIKKAFMAIWGSNKLFLNTFLLALFCCTSLFTLSLTWMLSLHSYSSLYPLSPEKVLLQSDQCVFSSSLSAAERLLVCRRDLTEIMVRVRMLLSEPLLKEPAFHTISSALHTTVQP